MVGRMGMIAIKGGGLINLTPGAMVRLKDVDNVRVLATQKGLILETGNNGRRGVKLGWKSQQAAKASKSAAKAAAKAAKASAKVSAATLQANSMSASAKSMAVSAEALAKAAKVAKAAAMPAKTAVVAAGAAKVAGVTAGSVLTSTTTSLGLGLGLGLGALGPIVVLGALAASTSGIYYYMRSKRTRDETPKY